MVARNSLLSHAFLLTEEERGNTETLQISDKTATELSTELENRTRKLMMHDQF